MKKENYLLNSIMKTKVKYYLIIEILGGLLSTYLGVEIINLTNEIITRNNSKLIEKLIIYSVIQMIIVAFYNISKRSPCTCYNYLSNSLIKKLKNIDYEFFIKWSPSEIININDKLNSISNIIKIITSLINNSIRFVIYLIAIVRIDYQIVLPILILLVIVIIISKITFKMYDKYDKNVRDTMSSRNKELDNFINGFQEVKSFCKSSDHIESLINKNDTIVKNVKCKNKLYIFNSFFFTLMDNVLSISILLYSLILINNGSLTKSLALTAISLTLKVIDPLLFILDGSSELSEMTAYIPKFYEIMNYQNKIKDGSIKLASFNECIEFDKVSFSYDDSKKVILDLDLKINKGESIGICGPSGGGKSTLMKLLPRFYDVDSGSLLIDHINIKNYSIESIRNKIGIIHQSPFIFDGTIKENLLYAKSEATEEELIDACKKAYIYNDIIKLKDKFDCKVGPKGLKLSGGQKQRIALARLILKNPEIIILDEATSALDNSTERLVQKSLEVFKDKTMIVIAHRLTTIKDLDKIVVIDDNNVKESGTHDELLALNGIYSNLYNN